MPAAESAPPLLVRLTHSVGAEKWVGKYRDAKKFRAYLPVDAKVGGRILIDDKNEKFFAAQRIRNHAIF